MDVHVLNGDALAKKFPVDGSVIICREALIEGPVQADSIEEFWKIRAAYLSENLEGQMQFYFDNVKTEFEKLTSFQNATAFHLWFEHDLFCQVNMWFIISYLKNVGSDIPVFRIMPPSETNQRWAGFGLMEESDLNNCFRQKIKFTAEDLALGDYLWTAYQKNDFKNLEKLSQTVSSTFPLLKEVSHAHIQRFPDQGLGRPQNKLKQITRSGITDFNEIFTEFWKTEGIYGFGDLQIKNILTTLK
jgi:hypothetical protein